MHRVITLTGLDRTGKATQAKLLSRALSPAKMKSFPDYDHWSGQIIRAILSEEEFEIRRWQGGTREILTSHQEVKEPYLFQALQFANARAHDAELRDGLAKHHWVLDRGPACAQAFGVVDGCDPAFVRALSEPQIAEDLVLVLRGGPFARAGEVPDMNERNSGFQQQVRQRYQTLIDRYDHWHEVPLHLTPNRSVFESIVFVHHAICLIVAHALPDVTIAPLPPTDIHALLSEGQGILPFPGA